jgi:hypothetical protein
MPKLFLINAYLPLAVSSWKLQIFETFEAIEMKKGAEKASFKVNEELVTELRLVVNSPDGNLVLIQSGFCISAVSCLLPF